MRRDLRSLVFKTAKPGFYFLGKRFFVEELETNGAIGRTFLPFGRQTYPATAFIGRRFAVEQDRPQK